MGLPRNPLRDLRDEYQKKYKLTFKQAQYLKASFLEQLEKCKNDELRRILLGATRKK